jgi:hypothetical protein
MFGIDSAAGELAGKVADRVLEATRPKTIFDLLKQPSTIAGLLGVIAMAMNASSIKEGVFIALSGISGVLMGRNTGGKK